MLTQKQKELVLTLYSTYRECHECTFDEFLQKACSKNIDALASGDINRICFYINEYTYPSTKQLDFLNSVFVYCGVDPVAYLSQLQQDNTDNIVSTDNTDITEKTITKQQYYNVLKRLQNDYQLFLPKMIHSVYMYRVLHQNKDYAIIEQIHNKTGDTLKILSFKKLLVCDWDSMTLDEIKDVLASYLHQYTFEIYKTHKGYHGYCVSEMFDHTAFGTLQLMYKLKCDQVYTSFTKVNGFVVRLQKKKGRDEQYIERYVESIGVKPGLKELQQLVQLKDALLEQ